MQPPPPCLSATASRAASLRHWCLCPCGCFASTRSPLRLQLLACVCGLPSACIRILRALVAFMRSCSCAATRRAHRFAFASLAAIRGGGGSHSQRVPRPPLLVPRSHRLLRCAQVAPSATPRAPLRSGRAVSPCGRSPLRSPCRALRSRYALPAAGCARRSAFFLGYRTESRLFVFFNFLEPFSTRSTTYSKKTKKKQKDECPTPDAKIVFSHSNLSNLLRSLFDFTSLIASTTFGLRPFSMFFVSLWRGFAGFKQYPTLTPLGAPPQTPTMVLPAFRGCAPEPRIQGLRPRTPETTFRGRSDGRSRAYGRGRFRGTPEPRGQKKRRG